MHGARHTYIPTQFNGGKERGCLLRLERIARLLFLTHTIYRPYERMLLLAIARHDSQNAYEFILHIYSSSGLSKCSMFIYLPFSDVSCFSAGRTVAAGRTAGSERPFELNA